LGAGGPLRLQLVDPVLIVQVNAHDLRWLARREVDRLVRADGPPVRGDEDVPLHGHLDRRAVEEDATGLPGHDSASVGCSSSGGADSG
jgi:hypothetical protein